jgi:hypothetical protein
MTMTMKTKYVDGMNEIKVDHELKQSIISRAVTNDVEPRIRARSFRSKTAMFAAACMIVILLAIGGPFIVHNADQTNTSALFSGFVITAYAADDAPLNVKPDVDFPLGQYSGLMSSVPGFPITISSKDADEIRLQTSEGELLRWTPSASKVIKEGKEATVKSGDTIYWSPLVEGSQSQAAVGSNLEITAYRNNKKLGSSTIEITTEDHIWYKGKLTNN